MSLVLLASGERFEIESPTGTRDGVLRQRERSILPLTFTASTAEEFARIKTAFADPERTEHITVYFPDEKDTASDAQLEGVAHKVYEGYTIPGEIKEEDKILIPGTPTEPPVYGRQLTIEMGRRQYGE